jgi:DNA-binding response OmpR family regulator
VDLRHELVTLDGQVLTLTQKEYCLLLLLVRHAGESLPRKTFEMRVWGHVLGTQSRQVDIHIRWLRKKLGIYGKQRIEAVHGVGYRFLPASPGLFVV